MTSPALIDTEAALQRAAASLTGARVLYVDTEFESTRDGTTLCLVQLSDGRDVHLIDALRVSLAPLAPVMNAPDVEWVLHAAQQDVPLLVDKLRGAGAPRLFDTQIAWSLLGPEYSVSLAYLVFRVLGLRTTKAHQADDWKRRPLPPSQLAYAASDVEHLPEFRRVLGERCAAAGRMDALYAASAEVAAPHGESASALSLDGFRNAWQLDAYGQAALRFLVDWYNALPLRERADAPEPKTLLAIAGRLPESGGDLARIKGVGRRFAEQHGNSLCGRMLRATADADTESFVPIDPPPYATFAELRAKAWLEGARAAVCESLSVAPELVLPGRQLERLREGLLAGQAPADVIDRIAGWRHALCAEAWRAHAARVPPP